MDKLQQRKLSKYGSEAVVSVKPIEGCWVLVASQNYRDYLRTIGVGRCVTCHESRVTCNKQRDTCDVTGTAWTSSCGPTPCSDCARCGCSLSSTGPVSLSTAQEPDKQWRVSTETMIKAKSVKGYRTGTRKWTENRFKVRGRGLFISYDAFQRTWLTSLTKLFIFNTQYI